MIDGIRELPLLMHLSLGHVKHISHPFVTTHDGLVFLDESLHSFRHECLHIGRRQLLEKGQGGQKISRRQLFHCEVVILDLADIVLNGNTHLEIEELIHSTLLVVLLEQLQLVVEEGYGDFVGLDFLHDLREAVLDLRVEVGLRKFFIVHGLFRNSS